MQSRLRTLRTLALSVACLGIAGVTQSFPVVMPGCAGGVPVSSFRLLVEPPKGGPAIPVTSVNVIRPGDKLRYEPTHLPVSAKHKGKIALMLIPASDQSSKGLKILEPKPAKDVQEWEVPLRTAVLGVVFGPQGLDCSSLSK